MLHWVLGYFHHFSSSFFRILIVRGIDSTGYRTAILCIYHDLILLHIDVMGFLISYSVYIYSGHLIELRKSHGVYFELQFYSFSCIIRN